MARPGTALHGSEPCRIMTHHNISLKFSRTFPSKTCWYTLYLVKVSEKWAESQMGPRPFQILVELVSTQSLYLTSYCANIDLKSSPPTQSNPICKLSFQHLVCEITQDFKTDLCFQSSAVTGSQAKASADDLQRCGRITSLL